MVPFFQNWSVGTLALYFSGPVKSVKTRTCTSNPGGGGVLDQYLGMGEPLRVWNPDLLANQINTRTLSSGTFSSRIGHIKEYPPPPPPKGNPVNMYWRVKTLCLSFCVMLFLHFTLLNQCFEKTVMSIANALLVGRKSMI